MHTVSREIIVDSLDPDISSAQETPEQKETRLVTEAP